MDLLIKSTIDSLVDRGVLLTVVADELTVKAYVVIAPTDLSYVETLVPPSVFESGAQVHVGNVTDAGDHSDQVVQILENMDSGDVAVYLCEGTVSYAQSLAVLGITENPVQH